MYTPAHFREDSPPALHELIRQHNFGLMVSTGPAGLEASHIPFLLDTSRGNHGVLLAHLARANEHWKSLESAGEVLVVFSGPHTYVSPSWYRAPEAVPTWNYVAVHAYGRARLLEPAELHTSLTRLVRQHEAGAPRPWSIDSVSREYYERLFPAIVGFEIELSRLIGKKKLNQNRSEEDRLGVIQALRTRDDSDAVAALMEETLKR